MPLRPRGIALILIVGLLTLTASLAAAMVVVQQSHREVGSRIIEGSRSRLLGVSGMERAVSELSRGATPSYGGEDYNGDGTRNVAGPEVDSQVWRPASFEIESCPARYALRPSFFSRGEGEIHPDGTPAPDRTLVDGRELGFSGRLRSAITDARRIRGDTYVLKVEDESGKVNVNGGVLGGASRDPARGWNGQMARILDLLGGLKEADLSEDVDGDGFLDRGEDVNGNGVMDPREDGNGNGILDPCEDLDGDRRLDGPDRVVQRWEDWNGNAVFDPSPIGIPDMGTRILAIRPAEGYHSVREVEEALAAGLGRPVPDLTPYLTVRSWTDRKVVRPNASGTVNPFTWSELKQRRGPLRLEEGGRPPVNLNAASRPVLQALLQGIGGSPLWPDRTTAPGFPQFPNYKAYRVTEAQAARIADAAVHFRGGRDPYRWFADAALAPGPFRTWSVFWRFLEAIPPIRDVVTPELVQANLDPNTKLQKQVPDQVAWHWVDKSDLDVWSTEGSLGSTGTYHLWSAGRLVDARGSLLACASVYAIADVFTLVRQTTQADFVGGRPMEEYLSAARVPDPGNPPTTGAHASWNTWGVGTGLGAVTHPCPPTALPMAAADFDGSVSLAPVDLVESNPTDGTLCFLHHFDDGWDAESLSTNPSGIPALVRDPPGVSPPPILRGDPAGSVWPPSGEPNPFLPDGFQAESWRCPTYRALANLPADADGDHAVVSLWVKMPAVGFNGGVTVSTIDSPVFFSLLRGAGTMTHLIGVGSFLEDGAMIMAERLQHTLMDANGTEVRASSTRMPMQVSPWARWVLVTAGYDIDEVTPAAGAFVHVGYGTPRAWLPYETYYDYPSAGHEKLVQDPSLCFSLGPPDLDQVWMGVDAYRYANQIVDEFAIADFGDDGPRAKELSRAWAMERLQDGRYYKGGDARFLSSEIRPFGVRPARVLSATWTVRHPTDPRQESQWAFFGSFLRTYSRETDARLGAFSMEVDLLAPDGVTVLRTLTPGAATGVVAASWRYAVRFLTPLGDPLQMPILETPFFDDITFAVQPDDGARFLAWEEAS